MAEVASPISGGLRIARRTVSADSFVAAAPPAVSQPDPVTTSLIARNSAGLTAVSNQLSSISQQVNALNAGMQNVYKNILTNTNLEKRQDQQEQEQQRRLAEQKLREGQESIVERRIQGALISPVQKIAAKASFTLSRLMGFFTTLLAGWLVNKGVQGIKQLAEGVKDKLEQVKNNVVKNLGFIGVVYKAIKTSLTSVFDIITGITNKIIKAVNIGIFLNPVKSLIGAVKKLGKNIYDFFVPGNKKEEENPNPADTTSSAATTTPAPASSVKYVIFGGQRFSELPNGDLTFPLDKRTKPTSEELKPKQGSTQSSISMVPETNTLQQPPPSNIASSMLGTSSSQEPDFTKQPQYGTSTVQEVIGVSMNQAPVDSVSSAQIMPIKPETKMKVEGIRPLPEATPTIIPITIPSAGAAARPQGSGQSGGSANSVPVIDPENPNNFYVMYAHSVYNVPMT